MTLNSNIESISATSEKVYTFLTELIRKAQFSNLSSIPNISNVTASENGCSFTINNMITCSMRLDSQLPFSQIVYKIDTDKGISALVRFNINDCDSGCSLQTEAEADVPIFLQGMIKQGNEKIKKSHRKELTWNIAFEPKAW